MLITSISYQNKQTGWTLPKFSLDRFNLLVGASGVGKTQILRALRTVQSFAAAGQIHHPVAFSIEFQHQEETYAWEIESAFNEHVVDVSPRGAGPAAITITREKLTSSSKGTVVDRSQDKFLFEGRELPQLNRSETALVLFAEKSTLDAAEALNKFVLDEHPYSGVVRLDAWMQSIIQNDQMPETWQHIASMPPTFKAFVLQQKQPEKFKELKELFKDIFTSIDDVMVGVEATLRAGQRINEQQILIYIKEHAIERWVSAANISSGMLRTFSHLVDLMLAPSGSVVLIDEFENSLGVNCMGPLTDFMLSRAAELQFIITSHHPYIISKIPKTYWKVVRRHGSTVKVTPAGEVRALQGSSSQDEFTRLINSPEFEEGIA